MFNPFSGVESLCCLTFFPRTGYIGFYLSNPPTFSRIRGEESFSTDPFIFGWFGVDARYLDDAYFSSLGIESFWVDAYFPTFGEGGGFWTVALFPFSCGVETLGIEALLAFYGEEGGLSTDAFLSFPCIFGEETFWTETYFPRCDEAEAASFLTGLGARGAIPLAFDGVPPTLPDTAEPMLLADDCGESLPPPRSPLINKACISVR